MKQYAFGVDIGGTTIKLGLFETHGKLCEKWEIITNKEQEGKHILADISKSVSRKCSERGISKDDVVGIGLGVPGPVSADGMVLKCVNLGWGIFNVEDELKQLTGFAVSAGNDANVAALGEMWQGGGKGYDNLVMVTLGTGVGGGVIMNGKIVSGAFGAGGEIGHMQMREDEKQCCGCGKKGCLEQYASATGLVKETNKLLQVSDRPSALRRFNHITAKDVFNAAKEQDKLALQAVDQMSKILGIALSHISCVFDPQIYVIGGGVSKAGQILIDNIQEHFRHAAFHASRNCAFALAKLGNDAGMYGAVKLLITKHSEVK